MTIHVLGFPTTLGLPRSAVRHGPEALRASGLLQALRRHDPHVVDHGDMAVPPGLTSDPAPTRVAKVVEAARRQRDHWLRVTRPGDLLLTIGGDHSTSLGTIMALAELGDDFDVVWVDAHGDFNTIETSPTGNPHGMVLSLAAGLLPDALGRVITPDRLHLWGIRDLDPGERRLLAAKRVEVLTPAEVRARREQILAGLRPNVFLSFDIDSVDPADAPGTMTPVPGGFTRDEAVDLVKAIVRGRNLIAMDLVEYHPDRDAGGLTNRLACAVLEAALGAWSRCDREASDAHQWPMASPHPF
ncbi:arginase [Symbiobacterium terraclitae]|uniref:Arginase n=1 Tax=Symbiobacterium terraclitae TaxID=557451 RepID=A0ABS4JQW8_9FIRM|nr:arginase [Symbiobacterium terraclitae]MBP2017933.1 arginase [Symbiobacterium terraclitae]